MYTLFNQPETFNRYVIGSPSIWWNKKIAFDFERDYAKSHTDLPANVFMAIGDFEQATNAEEGKVTDFLHLAEVLRERHYPSLKLSANVFADEIHVAVGFDAISRGLREVFKT